jgi:hypothetical protein
MGVIGGASDHCGVVANRRNVCTRWAQRGGECGECKQRNHSENMKLSLGADKVRLPPVADLSPGEDKDPREVVREAPA